MSEFSKNHMIQYIPLLIVCIVLIVCIIYNRRKFGPILTIMLISFVLMAMILGSLNSYKIENIKSKILSNRAFTIGLVIKYCPLESTGAGPSVGWVDVSFNDRSGYEYHTRSSILMPTKYTLNEPDGKHFMVIYDVLNPKNCILLFDYPVKDSTDYLKYIESFKIVPPSLKGGTL